MSNPRPVPLSCKVPFVDLCVLILNNLSRFSFGRGGGGGVEDGRNRGLQSETTPSATGESFVALVCLFVFVPEHACFRCLLAPRPPCALWSHLWHALALFAAAVCRADSAPGRTAHLNHLQTNGAPLGPRRPQRALLDQAWPTLVCACFPFLAPLRAVVCTRSPL